MVIFILPDLVIEQYLLNSSILGVGSLISEQNK